MHHVKKHTNRLQRSEKFVGNAAWDDFVAWCKRKKLNAMPANAWTLAAYIRSLENDESLNSLRKRVADIGKAHAEKSKRRPERHPLIAKTFDIIEKQAEKRGATSKVFDGKDITAPSSNNSASRASQDRSVDVPPHQPKTRVMRSRPKLVSKRRPK